MTLRLSDAYWDDWCPAGWGWTIRAPGFLDCDLWVVRAGAGQIRVDGGEWEPIGRGWCRVFRPGMTVEGRQDERNPLRVWAHHFDATGPDRARLPAAALHLQELAPYEGLFERMACIRSFGNRSVMTDLLRAILAMLSMENPDASDGRYAPRRGGGLAEAARRIRETPEKRWGNVELARIAGLHPNYFVRAFARYFGLPPRQYAVRERCERARRMLAGSDLSVKQVALVNGYPDQAAFSRQFRQVTGMAPSAVRKG